MGNQQSSYKLATYQHLYQLQPAKNHFFFGVHTLLVNKNNRKDVLISKDILFHSDSQYQEFMNAYQSLNRKPFSLVYPKDIIDNPTNDSCTTSRQVRVYLQLIGKPLLHIVQTQGIFSETKAWFLLNQISKALEILQNQGRAHWAVSPQTIFCNRYNNYLLYDSLFVLGTDPSNFLIESKNNGSPLTPKLSKIISHNSYPSVFQGRQQDMYMLGLTLFFVLTGINIRKLPPQPQKVTVIQQILTEITLSRQMKHIIRSMIQSNTLKRMDNVQLRRLLKDKQTTIIKNQSMETMKHSTVYPQKIQQPLFKSGIHDRTKIQEHHKTCNDVNSPKHSQYASPSLYASQRQSGRPSVQPSIDNQNSRKITSFQIHVPAKMTMTPHRPQSSVYRNEPPLLSRIHSADTLIRW